MRQNFRILPKSSFIQPLYQKWSQPEATEESIIQDFQEMLEKDFNEIDPEKHNGCLYSSRKLIRCFDYEPRYYKHKTHKNIFAAVIKKTETYPELNTTEITFPEVTHEYKIYDDSPSIQHYHYGILSHYKNNGEVLITPVPNWAEHITLAENSLVMLRPSESTDSMACGTLSSYPVLKKEQ